MSDRVTANLPARDLDATAAFYAKLGFVPTFKDDGWMILRRGPLEIEFFLYAQIDPRTTIASCCIRVADLDALHAEFAAAKLPGNGTPRLTPPVDQPWGMREFALVDPDGNLLRCLSPL
jgi:catechol 2,3-dioxygenase-like lactoylglutathione lyase family enzyme